MSGNFRSALFIGLVSLSLPGCQSMPSRPLVTADHVELERFMGDWYVIASIPTFIETDAYNAVESYRLDPDGTIATTFTFREAGFDGPLRRYTATGYVLDASSNAVWGMQFIWPIKADYRVMYLSGDYDLTVIGREKRDYVWIMARTPDISDERYRELVTLLEMQGYDISNLRRVPQQWAGSGQDP